MTPEQQAAYVNSQAVCALIEAMGMTAENQFSIGNGNGVIHGADSFLTLIDKWSISHNAVLTMFGR